MPKCEVWERKRKICEPTNTELKKKIFQRVITYFLQSDSKAEFVAFASCCLHCCMNMRQTGKDLIRFFMSFPWIGGNLTDVSSLATLPPCHRGPVTLKCSATFPGPVWWNSYPGKCTQYPFFCFLSLTEEWDFFLNHTGMLLVPRSHLLQCLYTVVLKEMMQTRCDSDCFIGFLCYWFHTNAG